MRPTEIDKQAIPNHHTMASTPVIAADANASRAKEHEIIPRTAVGTEQAATHFISRETSSIIGHITDVKFGKVLVTRDNQEFELKAQGWTHLSE